MLLGGLWHGANWTFVVWGAYHGTLLDPSSGSRAGRARYQRLPQPLRVAPHVRPRARLVGLVPAPIAARRARLLRSDVRRRRPGARTALLPALLYTPRAASSTWPSPPCSRRAPVQAHDWSRQVTWPKAILVQPLFAASLLVMFSQSFNPFLYFQF